MNTMSTRYRLVRRGSRGGRYYCVDTKTGQRVSLNTSDAADAQEIVDAKNKAAKQPALNLQLAKAYMAGTDNGIISRTWREAFEMLTNTKKGPTKDRWLRAAKDPAYAPLLPRVITDTPAELLLKVMASGTVSTNIHLRRLHNFCVDMNFLAWPLIPKRQWPAVRHQPKRAITAEEHARIVAREKNPERQAYYKLAWHLGASQSDLANLHAEDVDWTDRVISFDRQKTRWRGQQPPQIRFGAEVEAILNTLPKSGPLFPGLKDVRSEHRATEFRQRCHGLGIYGITLHSYRYSWAERAKVAGYPERYAQLALGHNSKAVHRAYARKAQVTLPPLEEYEAKAEAAKIIPIPVPKAG